MTAHVSDGRAMNRPQLVTIVLLSLAAAAEISCARDPVDYAKLDAELLQSARKGDTATLLRLLQQGAHIEAKDQDGLTALALAADYRHPDTAKLLLEKGAGPIVGHLSGASALIEAAGEGNATKVTLVLERGTDLKAKNESLFAMGRSRPLVLQMPTTAEPIHNQNQEQDVTVGFPLENDTAIVRLLLDQGANIESRDEEGATPLMVAAEHGQSGVVRALLEKGAEVAARDTYGNTALIGAACECAVVDMSETLESMRLLLGKGANINAKNKTGTTALMAAASAGRSANIQLLLDKGANIEAKDSHGDTALLLSASGSGLPSADATKMLLARGANLEARNNDGDTALILAASKGGYEDAATVRLLLNRGANVGVENKHGQTALDQALKNHRGETVPLLRKGMVSRVR
jgi:ankyrin repeat protein